MIQMMRPTIGLATGLARISTGSLALVPVLILALILPGFSSAQEAPELEVLGATAVRLERVERLLDDAVSSRKAGSAIGLVARKGETVLLRSVGEADPGVPITDDAIVRLSSSAKVITAVAALILYEEGSVRLGDPLSSFVPEFSESRTQGDTGELESPFRPITVHDVMTHTSGLAVTGDAFELLWEEAAYEDALTTREFSSRLAKIPMTSQPGELFEYGYYGSSYEVLAAVIEAAGGMRLDEFITQRIFRPLGMVDSYFTVPEDKRSRLAARYYRTPEGELEIHEQQGVETPAPRFIAGGGAVRTTIRDFHRFLQCLLNGGELDGVRILSPETVDLMLSPHVSSKMYGARSGDYGWGYGGRVRTRVPSGGLGSVGSYGWNGGTGTYYWIDPSEELVAILFVPFRPPAPSALYDAFETAVYQELSDSPGD